MSIHDVHTLMDEVLSFSETYRNQTRRIEQLTKAKSVFQAQASEAAAEQREASANGDYVQSSTSRNECAAILLRAELCQGMIEGLQRLTETLGLCRSIARRWESEIMLAEKVGV